MLRIVILCLITSAVSAQTQLKLASDPWPPFTNVQGEEAFALDLVGTGLSRSGVEMHVKVTSFDDVMQKIQSGEYDGSAALWKSPEREKTLLFSVPYLQNQLVLVGRKGSDVSAKNFTTLNGKKVAIVANYAYGDEVNEAAGVYFVEGSSDQENLEKLLNYKVDFLLADALLVQYLLTHQKEEVARFLEIGREPLVRRSLHLAIRKNVPHASELIGNFNDQILDMVADGTYNEILQLHWIRADVDGDGTLELIPHSNLAGLSAPTSSYSVYFETPVTSAANDRYYIDGKFYNKWNDVPAKYKAAPQTNEDKNRSNVLRLKF